MSARTEHLNSIAERVRQCRKRERTLKPSWGRFGQLLLRWWHMLHHEFVNDEVRIRAESLAYLTLFSVLPLIAGCFFIFTLFTQVAMVQDSLQGLVDHFLTRIPEGHRGFVEEYILKFKDAYLASLTQKSGTLGIFSFGVLAWVGLKMYSNIDNTLNHIWHSERQRPLSEQVRNFIVVSVLAPLVLIGGLSVPLILKQLPITKKAFEFFPVLTVFLNDIIPAFLIFAVLSLMYKYLPVERVRWRSAIAGGVSAMMSLQLSSYLMQIYFHFGTNSAYGKAAVAPLLGFWIYVVWIVVIMGAELSYLLQHGKAIWGSHGSQPSFVEGEALLVILYEMLRVYKTGKTPLGIENLEKLTDLDGERLRRILKFCMRQGFIVECLSQQNPEQEKFVLAKDLSESPVSELFRIYFLDSAIPVDGPISKIWQESLEHWLGFYKNRTLASFGKK